MFLVFPQNELLCGKNVSKSRARRHSPGENI
jgi:hypothetical protein